MVSVMPSQEEADSNIEFQRHCVNPPTTDHATDHRPPTTYHRPPTNSHRPPTSNIIYRPEKNIFRYNLQTRKYFF